MKEYVELIDGQYSENSFLEFLRDKLEIDGYWEKAGVA
jgi:hypothetical protein